MQNKPNAPFEAVLDGKNGSYIIGLNLSDGRKRMKFTKELCVPEITQYHIDYINMVLERKFEYKDLSVMQEGDSLVCRYTRVFPPEFAWKNKIKTYKKAVTESISILDKGVKEIEKILAKENFLNGEHS